MDNLVNLRCEHCCEEFYISEQHAKKLEKTNGHLFCPNGHVIFFLSDVFQKVKDLELQFKAASDNADHYQNESGKRNEEIKKLNRENVKLNKDNSLLVKKFLAIKHILGTYGESGKATLVNRIKKELGI